MTKKKTLQEDLEEVAAKKEQDEKLLLQARLANKTSELTSAQTLIRSLTAENERMSKVHNFLKTPTEVEPPWAIPKKRKSSDKHGTVGLLLSDLHLDEVVLPSEMRGRNAYNREIADMRLRKVFNSVIEQATYYHQGTKYDGAYVALGGDLVNGDIHPELKETNEYPVPETIRFWVPKIASGLEMLADQFGFVEVAAVPGNHGRLGLKPRYKKRALDNADWLMSALLAERFSSDSRFKFDVPESMDTSTTIYDTTLLLTHGDQAGGGSGIGGIFPGIMRMKARKQANFEFDWLLMGHFHQYLHTQHITVNGSLKGWDEYALGHNFVYEPPNQAMFILTPEHGVTWPIELYCEDRKAEGW